MERNVYQLESGNYDFDDSEIKQVADVTERFAASTTLLLKLVMVSII
jgi:hypothetical protein